MIYNGPHYFYWGYSFFILGWGYWRLGAGKSTLARAITGVWRPPGDEIRLDGVSLDNYEPDILGYHIGYLPLRVQLFDETIADNITRLRDQQFRALELGERTQALLDRLERMDIRAPGSSIVYGLTVFTPRSVIRAAEPVMYLIPQDHPLITSAQVSPINIDELFVSQDVTYAFQH